MVIIDGEKPEPVELPEKSKMFKDFLLSLDGDENAKTYQEESFMLTDVCLRADDSAENSTVVDC